MGDKNKCDEAATNAMRNKLNSIYFNGIISIGEGAKDNAPMLFNGERVGKLNDGPLFKLAVDPLDGTTQAAKLGKEAMCIIAMTDGHFFETEEHYMWKVCSKYEFSHKELKNIHYLVSEIKKKVKFPTFCLLDRPRHKDLVETLLELNCRIKLIQDCDVSASISAMTDNIDCYLGYGGAPEGVISAAAIKNLKGYFYGMIEDKVLTMDDLVTGNSMFCASAVTDGCLLEGIKLEDTKAAINSLMITNRYVRNIKTLL